ncbi:hypothetical protein [Comamonas sp. JC664]|uniref:hypothetical protein n=1 Tax=Comamonas sp. JC664 TaxID=2801917 RepID=UPI00191DF930|nr:hypothetical protein [Comamonas sp. JC664]MBL0695250.1 hypothetical protein [Comamonas sp. JC664]
MMRRTLKNSLAALAALALIPASVTAHTVKGTHTGSVTALTNYSSGTFHGAVDIGAGGRCNYWGAETGVVGSVYWAVTIRTSGVVCNGNGSGNQNEARHAWASGWTFRQWHWIKTADSRNRTCDRCQVGNIGGTGNSTGPHAHLQQDKLGTKDTAWYRGYVSVGTAVTRAKTIGVLD